RVWAACSHENILKFIGYCTENDFMTVYLFSPYMRNGNAKTYLEKRQSTMEERFLLIRDTLMGLDYLHNFSPPVVHGNLRAFNVLITETGKAVLSDVGLAAIDRHLIATTPWASVRWYSPEFNLGDLVTRQSDIWSWACVVLQLLTGDLPYSSIQSDEHIKLIKGGILTPEAFHKLDKIPDILVQLLQRCWKFDLSDRPNARECMDTLNSMLSADSDGE
ncbi:hypothetical protein M407DRAFT_51364, partial [Tulasnella calospora MUT 4182]